MSSIPHKVCLGCGDLFPSTAEYFHRDAKSHDGLRSKCKVCMRAQVSDYYAEMRDIHTQLGMRTSSSEHGVQYRLKHPPKLKHRTILTPEQRQLRRSAKVREYERNRRARKHCLPITFTEIHEQRALDYFGGCCAVCGCQLNDPSGIRKLAWDHWNPLSKGGATTPDNMLPLCHGKGGCNTLKSSRDPVAWVTHRFKSKAKAIIARIETYFAWVKEQDE